MKLLKFNEMMSSDKFTELKELCKNYLSYLEDEGYYIGVTMDQNSDNNKNYAEIRIFGDSSSFTIDSHLKNTLIPFIHILKERYKLMSFYTRHNEIDDDKKYSVIRTMRLGKITDYTIYKFDSDMIIDMVKYIEIYVEEK